MSRHAYATLRTDPELSGNTSLSSGMDARDMRVFQPERRLMLAVLEEAAAVLWKHATGRSRSSRRRLEEAISWCDSDDVTWPFSFVNVCQALDLDIEWVRSGLRDLRHRSRSLGPLMTPGARRAW